MRLDTRKYYDRAIKYQKILILATEVKPYSPFPVNLSDFTLQLKQKLVLLPSFELQRILEEVILRIFKDLDDEYNDVFPKDDPISKRFRTNLTKEIGQILRVELVE